MAENHAEKLYLTVFQTILGQGAPSLRNHFGQKEVHLNNSIVARRKEVYLYTSNVARRKEVYFNNAILERQKEVYLLTPLS